MYGRFAVYVLNDYSFNTGNVFDKFFCFCSVGAKHFRFRVKCRFIYTIYFRIVIQYICMLKCRNGGTIVKRLDAKLRQTEFLMAQ